MTDSASESLAKVNPPTDEQLRMARAVLGPLTETQRRAVIAVVVHEAALEIIAESTERS